MPRFRGKRHYQMIGDLVLTLGFPDMMRCDPTESCIFRIFSGKADRWAFLSLTSMQDGACAPQDEPFTLLTLLDL